MPWIDPPAQPEPRQLAGVEPPEPLRPTGVDILGAAFRLENPMVNVARSLLAEQFPPGDPDYNPMSDIRGTKYAAQYIDRFITSRSPRQTLQIMSQIDGEEADRKTLEAAGFAGWAAQVAAGMADPTLALPAGVIVRSVKGGYEVGRSARSVGLAAGTQIAGQEAILQGAQETRSLGESAGAIGVGTLLGAVLGAGAARLLSSAERRTMTEALATARAETDAHATGEVIPSPTKDARNIPENIPVGRADADGTFTPTAEWQVVPEGAKIALYGPDGEPLGAHTITREDGSTIARIEPPAPSAQGAPPAPLDPTTDTLGAVAALRAKTVSQMDTASLRKMDRAFSRTDEIEGLDELRARAAAPTDMPMIVYRGAHGEERLFQRGSFISTSNRREPAEIFATPFFEGEARGVVAEIHVHPGVRAFVPDSGVQHEVVLAPDTQMHVVGRSTELLQNGKEIDTLKIIATAPDAPSARAPAVGAAQAQAAGAAATDTRTLELESYGFDRIPVARDIVRRFSPTRDVLTAESVVARRTVVDLAETPYRFKENVPQEGRMVEGVLVGARDAAPATQGPALDRLARMEINGARVQVSDEMLRLYSEYRYGQPDATQPVLRALASRFMGQDEGKMTYGEFKREVAISNQEGDTHPIPQVAQAAQFIRNRVYEPWKKRAIEAGLLPEDASTETAVSYFQRVWNKQAITARRPEFVNIVTDWLAKDQAVKAAAKERMTALSNDLKAAETAVNKADTEESAAAATLRRDQLRERLETEIAAWEGKSVNEARTAIKAREKYAAGAERPEGAPRLESADRAIDRVVARIIESDRELDTEALRARAHEITDRILGSPDGRLPYDIHMGGPEVGWSGPGGQPPRGPLARRDFMIPDRMIRDFLEMDAEHVAALHLRTMVPDVLLTERFGDVRMTEALKRIQEDYAAKIDGTNSQKEAKRLGNERDRVIKDIVGIRDRIRSVYGWSPNLANAARVVNVAKSFNNLTSMGVASISSLSDMAGTLLRHGVETGLREGWAPYFRALSGNPEVWEKNKAQWRAVGIGVETDIAARQHALDDTFDVYRPQSRFERGLQAVTDRFFIANLLAPMTDRLKLIAANVASAEILRASEAVARGKATKKQLTMLADANIDQQMAGRIWQQFADGGGEVIDGVRVPNTADWRDREAMQAFTGAVARDAEIAVVTPGQEKPLTMSDPVWSVLFQFKSFTASATERILIANLQKRDAQVLQGVVASLALGMLSYRLNALFGGQPVSDRPNDWFKEAVARSGLIGWFEEGNALASKMTRGSVDVYRLIGADKPLSRYASRSASDMLLGPSVAKIESFTKGLSAATTGDWTESDTKAIRRLIPLQNLFYLRGLLNQVEAGFNGAFGIEMKAPRQ